MWNTIKDYALATFYVVGAAVLIMLVGMMSIVLLIPVLIYGTYKIMQIRRQIREQSNVKVKYTTPDHHHTQPHED